MIHEITQRHYWGVRCSRCTERIPVPKRAADLYEELTHGEASEGQGAKSCAFTLRCKVCDEEGVYGVLEIQEFEWPPRIRRFEGKRTAAGCA